MKFTGFNADFSGLDAKTSNAFKQFILQSKSIVQDLSDIKASIITKHSELDELAYASSGHTGFEPTVTRYFAIFRDEKSNNTEGGTFTAGAWRDRTLNVEHYNNITGCSLSSNIVTLPAGTYKVRAWAAAHDQIDVHKIKLLNNTDTSDTIIGLNGCNYNGGTGESSVALLTGIFTITASKGFKLQHRCGSNGTFGKASNFSTIEVYAEIEFEKIG